MSASAAASAAAAAKPQASFATAKLCKSRTECPLHEPLQDTDVDLTGIIARLRSLDVDARRTYHGIPRVKAKKAPEEATTLLARVVRPCLQSPDTPYNTRACAQHMLHELAHNVSSHDFFMAILGILPRCLFDANCLDILNKAIEGIDKDNSSEPMKAFKDKHRDTGSLIDHIHEEKLHTDKAKPEVLILNAIRTYIYQDHLSFANFKALLTLLTHEKLPDINPVVKRYPSSKETKNTGQDWRFKMFLDGIAKENSTRFKPVKDLVLEIAQNLDKLPVLKDFQSRAQAVNFIIKHFLKKTGSCKYGIFSSLGEAYPTWTAIRDFVIKHKITVEADLIHDLTRELGPPEDIDIAEMRAWGIFFLTASGSLSQEKLATDDFESYYGRSIICGEGDFSLSLLKEDGYTSLIKRLKAGEFPLTPLAVGMALTPLGSIYYLDAEDIFEGVTFDTTKAAQDFLEVVQKWFPVEEQRQNRIAASAAASAFGRGQTTFERAQSAPIPDWAKDENQRAALFALIHNTKYFLQPEDGEGYKDGSHPQIEELFLFLITVASRATPTTTGGPSAGKEEE